MFCADVCTNTGAISDTGEEVLKLAFFLYISAPDSGLSCEGVSGAGVTCGVTNTRSISGYTAVVSSSLMQRKKKTVNNNYNYKSMCQHNYAPYLSMGLLFESGSSSAVRSSSFPRQQGS